MVYSISFRGQYDIYVHYPLSMRYFVDVHVHIKISYVYQEYPTANNHSAWTKFLLDDKDKDTRYISALNWVYQFILIQIKLTCYNYKARIDKKKRLFVLWNDKNSPQLASQIFCTTMKRVFQKKCGICYVFL